MARAISNIKATRLYVEQMQRENAELKAALHALVLHVVNVVKIECEPEPVLKALALFKGIEKDRLDKISAAAKALRETGKWTEESK